MLVITIDYTSLGIESYSWKQTTGTIVESSIKESSIKEHTFYNVDIRYKYTIGGKVYINDVKKVGSMIEPSFSSMNEAKTELSRWNPGSSIVIYYDKEKPECSALSVGLPLESIFPIIFSVSFFVTNMLSIIGVFMVFISQKGKLRESFLDYFLERIKDDKGHEKEQKD
jgi:hypothetical protein